MALADTVLEQLDPQVRSYIEDLEKQSASLARENEHLSQEKEALSNEVQSLVYTGPKRTRIPVESGQ